MINDSDYNWYHSFGYLDLEQKSRGIFVVKNGRIQEEPNEAHRIHYTAKDISQIPEKKQAGFGLYHFIEKRKDGSVMYSGAKINPHRWEKDFWLFAHVVRGWCEEYCPAYD